MTKAQVIALIDQYIYANGNEEITAVQVNSVLKALANQDIPFSEILSKPTTLSGYGITNAYTKGQSDSRYFRKDIEDTKLGTASFEGQVNIRNKAFFTEDGVRGFNILTNVTDGVSIGSYTNHDVSIRNRNTEILKFSPNSAQVLGTITATNLSGTNTGDQDISHLAEKSDVYTKSESDGKYLLNTSDQLIGNLLLTGKFTNQGEAVFSEDGIRGVKILTNSTDGASIGTYSSHDFLLKRGNSTKLTLTSSGVVVIGNLLLTGKLTNQGEAVFSEDGIRGVKILTNSTDGASIGTYTSHDFLLKRGNSTKLTLTSSGVVVNGNITANAFFESSDVRLKDNIQPLNYGLKEIEKIDTHTWNWKSDGSEDMGLIAQELELIMPELVKTDEEGYKSVNYSKLVPVLINAIKELSNGKKS